MGSMQARAEAFARILYDYRYRTISSDECLHCITNFIVENKIVISRGALCTAGGPAPETVRVIVILAVGYIVFQCFSRDMHPCNLQNAMVCVTCMWLPYNGSKSDMRPIAYRVLCGLSPRNSEPEGR
jgi:hypothetical protein